MNIGTQISTMRDLSRSVSSSYSFSIQLSSHSSRELCCVHVLLIVVAVGARALGATKNARSETLAVSLQAICFHAPAPSLVLPDGHPPLLVTRHHRDLLLGRLVRSLVSLGGGEPNLRLKGVRRLVLGALPCLKNLLVEGHIVPAVVAVAFGAAK